jgi:hypothetical protein
LKTLGSAAGEGFRPHLQRALAALLHEHDLPVVVAHRQDVAVVADVEEDVARALRFLAGDVAEQAEAVDVVLVGPPDRLVAVLSLSITSSAPAISRKVGIQS